MSTRLILKQIDLIDNKIVISSLSIIDSATGNEIRIAKPTEELIEFLRLVEIEVDDYFSIIEMQKKNPNLKKLINTYKLYL